MGVSTEQTSALADEAPTSRKTKPVELRSAHDYTLTVQALEARAEDLKKLATKNQDEGYTREARSIQADVASIEQHVLPAFRAQRELPLVTEEHLEKEILGALRPLVWQAFNGLDNPKTHVTPAMLDRKREELLDTLVARVQHFATELAEESFNQGSASRQQTAEALAMRCIKALRSGI